MDTEYDFLTPEFLNILFFQQKNLLIYPYVDIENLRILQNFLIGYKIIEIESSDLFNIKDVVTLEIEENESIKESFFIISNLPRKDIQSLSKVKGLHCIINTSANLTDLKTEAFVIYNKKRQQFINYQIEEQDMTFERKIFSEREKKGSISTTLQKINDIAKKIVYGLNEDNDEKRMNEILNDYGKDEARKIIEYTRNFYSIEESILDLKRFGGKKCSEKIFTQNRTANSNMSEEYQKIISSNKRLSAEFIPTLHEYRFKKLNERNLDLYELYSPESLYTYLRRHHWKNGIPEDFLREWVKMENTGYKLTEQDILDFEILLNELKTPSKILLNIMVALKLQESSEEYIEKNLNKSNLEKKREQKKEENQRIKKALLKKIPSVQNFDVFKSWILRKLEDLEQSLNRNPH